MDLMDFEVLECKVLDLLALLRAEEVVPLEAFVALVLDLLWGEKVHGTKNSSELVDDE